MCHGLEGYLAKLQCRILENVDGIRNLTITGRMDSPKFGNGCDRRKKMIFEIVMKHIREAGFLWKKSGECAETPFQILHCHNNFYVLQMITFTWRDDGKGTNLHYSKARVIKLTAGLESVVGVSDVISGVSVSVVSCDSSVIASQKCDGEGELDEHLSVSLSQLLLHL